MITTEGNLLCVGDLPVTALVGKYGEPLYVYDLEIIERQHRKLRRALPRAVGIYYSMKANPNVSLVSFLGRLTEGVEVSSLRELYVAREAGFTPDRIIFVGPSKSEEELTEAVAQSIHCLVIESEHELELASRLAAGMGKRAGVALRVNPSLDAVGSRLKMGGASCQFGIDEEAVEGVLRRARSLPGIRVEGLHVYMGTQLLDYEVALRNTKYVLEMGRRLRRSAGVELRLIDFGGGVGVPYFEGDQTFDLESFGRALHEFFEAYQGTMPGTSYAFEAGRYLVAESGIYVTRARHTKWSRGRKFILTSGGLNHNHTTVSGSTLVNRHSLIEVLNKMDAPKVEEADICGPLCTPNDVLGQSVKVAGVEPGDLIGVLRAGAYGMTASIVDFLSHARPSEVMVYKGKDFLIRRPGPVSEILNGQVLVPLAPESTV